MTSPSWLILVRPKAIPDPVPNFPYDNPHYPQLSTAIHRKKKKQKERGPAGDELLLFLQRQRHLMKQQDISTWLNYRTFLNGLDKYGREC